MYFDALMIFLIPTVTTPYLNISNYFTLFPPGFHGFVGILLILLPYFSVSFTLLRTYSTPYLAYLHLKLLKSFMVAILRGIATALLHPFFTSILV